MPIQEQLTLVNKFPITRKAVFIESNTQKIQLNEKLDVIKAKIDSTKNLPQSEKDLVMKEVVRELQELRTKQIGHIKDSFDFMHLMSQLVNE